VALFDANKDVHKIVSNTNRQSNRDCDHRFTRVDGTHKIAVVERCLTR